MAHTQEEEIVLGTASPDLKRKHNDLDPDSHQLAPQFNGNSGSDSVKKIDDDDTEDGTEPKRQRLDETNDITTGNSFCRCIIN